VANGRLSRTILKRTTRRRRSVIKTGLPVHADPAAEPYGGLYRTGLAQAWLLMGTQLALGLLALGLGTLVITAS